MNYQNQFSTNVLLAVAIFIALTACRKDPMDVPISFSVGGQVSLDTLPPLNINVMKPTNVKDTSGPVTVQSTSNAILYRYGVEVFTDLNTVTGTLAKDVPTDILHLLTQGNVAFKSVTNATTLTGWTAKSIVKVDNSGRVLDISAVLSKEISDAMSVNITYFPDGYYSIVNNADSTKNEWGWYQVVLTNNMDITIPLVIIYHSLGSGVDFSGPDRDPKAPIQGYGIWGLDRENFYPLFQLRFQVNVFLKMKTFTY